MAFKPTVAQVIRLVYEALEANEKPSRNEIEEHLDFLLAAGGPFESLRPEKEDILNVILERTRVWIGPETTLEDAEGHEDWLDDARAEGPFWARLKSYFLTEMEPPLPPSVVNALHRSTEKVLGQLESPDRDPQWDRRGLVAGSIQSGKTGHYVALAAKALDAGYQIIIILAGVHNSLRSQTQQRVDEQLIGKNAEGELIGVRKIEQQVRQFVTDLPNIITITTADEGGDFKIANANVRIEAGTESRLVIVVKKHTGILENLTKWLKRTNVLPSNQETGRVVAPTLVIDDEADFASINTTRDPEADPTATNKLIRQLLLSLERVGFVGYTATPQANIYIPVDVEDDEFGPDLFPKAFIHNLQSPSNYIGPDLVFGHPGDDSVGIGEQRALPMYVPVDSSRKEKSEVERWMPAKHKTTHVPGPLPGSLTEAIRLFVLVAAARVCRGDKNHNSMLVHVTRLVDVQKLVAQRIETEVDNIAKIICYGGRADRDAQQKVLKAIWDRRIVQDHVEFTRVSDCRPLPPWTEVWTKVRKILDRIRVKQFNGTSADALDYKNEKKAKQVVIAVGGDKLSRGLTLEGLSVSYFLRASRMSDTLMQMGRWFGYRPGYVDLCRVYTTTALHKAFREFALGTDELRQQLDLMAATNKNPTQFGLRIRIPSENLLITAANKIRNGEKVTVQFADTNVQTLEVATTGSTATRNLDAARALITTLDRRRAPEEQIRGRGVAHRLWHGMPAEMVLSFLEDYEAFSRSCFYDRCLPLRRYIKRRNSHDELKEWTVVIASKETPKTFVTVGTQSVGLITRKCEDAPQGRFYKRGIMGSADEAWDLDRDEFRRAAAGGPTAKREAARAQRPAKRGLFILYPVANPDSDDPNAFLPLVAISFPRVNAGAGTQEYMVSEVWRREHGLSAAEDADELE